MINVRSEHGVAENASGGCPRQRNATPYLACKKAGPRRAPTATPSPCVTGSPYKEEPCMSMW